MSAFYAQDFNREFYVGMILGGTLDSTPLWSADRWDEWIDALDQMVSRARNSSGVEGCVEEPFVEFTGRHQYNDFKTDQWRDPPPDNGTFVLWQLMAPSNRVCASENRCPDVHVSLLNLGTNPQKKRRFHTSVLLAIAADLPGADQSFSEAMRVLNSSVPGLLTATKLRPWGIGTPLGYNRGISETQWLNMPLLSGELSSRILLEKWDHVEIAARGGGAVE